MRRIQVVTFFIIYQLIQLIALPVILVYLLVRRIRRGPLGQVKQRLGLVPSSQPGNAPLWLHAVSVGETLATEQIIRDLQARLGSQTVYLTNGTIGGYGVGSRLKADYHSMAPFDLLPCMLLTYHRIRPRALVLIEAELWPNLLMIAALYRIPVYLLNARISDRGQKRSTIAQWLSKFLLSLIDTIWCQDHTEQQKFFALGLPAEHVQVMGQIKSYNVVKKQELIPWGALTPATLAATPFATVLAGSWHPGELETLLAAFITLRTHVPDARLIVAPRHLHWHQQLVDQLTQAGLRTTTWRAQQPAISTLEDIHTALQAAFAQHDVVVINTTGLMFMMYPFASAFVLGGTFVPIGGHNVLEPCVWNVATVVGPWHQNSRHAVAALQTRGGIAIANDQTQLAQVLTTLLTDTVARRAQASAAHAWLQQDADITQQALQHWYNQLTRLSAGAK